MRYFQRSIVFYLIGIQIFHTLFPLYATELEKREDLGALVVKVTEAKPDIRRQELYKLTTSLSPRLEEISKQKALLDPEGLKGALKRLVTHLITPEKKVNKRALEKDQWEEALIGFQTLTQEIEAFRTLFNKTYQQYKWFSKELQERVTLSLNQLSSFYITYQEDLKKAPSEQQKNFLSSKAVMCGDLWEEGIFWLLPQTTTQDLLSFDYEGRRKEKKIGQNHYVTSLTKENSSVYFKLNGHPPLKPGKEALLSELYKTLGIPVPQTGLIILDHLHLDSSPTNEFFHLGHNKEPFILQVSKGIQGRSLEEVLRESLPSEASTTIAPEGSSLSVKLEEEAYGKQVIGAFLTTPSDQKPANFIYTPKGKVVPIDNDEIFEEPLITLPKADSPRVHLKSVLFTFPQMDFLPLSVKKWLSDMIPNLQTVEWLKALEKRNK